MRKTTVPAMILMAACALMSASTRGARAQEMTTQAKTKLPPGAKVILVDDDRQQFRGAPFSYINNAIYSANPGDVIRVAPGIYREQIAVTKNVRIEGAQAGRAFGAGKKFVGVPDSQQSIIVAGPNLLLLPILKNTVVTFAAGGATMDGFTVRGAGDNTFSVGIGLASGVPAVSILNSRIENATYGISLTDQTDTLIQGNAILNNRDANEVVDGTTETRQGYGILGEQPITKISILSNVFAGNQTAGVSFGKLAIEASEGQEAIEAVPVTNAIISENTFDASLSQKSSGAGVVLLNANSITLSKNTIRGGNRAGIYLDSRDPEGAATQPTSISQNLITGVNGDGVFLSNSLLSGVITKNTVSNNSGSGFYLSEVSTFINAFNLFSRNVVNGNGDAGFRVVASLGNNIENNQISGNGVGVSLDESQDNQLRSNSITNSVGDGISSDQFASGNVFTGNKISGSGRFDIEDLSIGDAFDGTDNIYRSNKAATANPATLISKGKK